MKHYQELLNDLIAYGGALICSTDSDEVELIMAKAENRFALFPEVNGDEFGLIRRPKEWLENIHHFFERKKKAKAVERGNLCSFKAKKLLTQYKNAIRNCDAHPAADNIEEWEKAVNEYKKIYAELALYIGDMERELEQHKQIDDAIGEGEG